MLKILDGVRHDLHNRYAGSVFGIGWAILYPAVLVAIYALLYGQVYKTRPEGMEVISYVFLISAGIMPIVAFSESLAVSSGVFENNRHLLHSSTIDPRTLPIRSTIVGQMSGLGGLIVVIAYMFVTNQLTWFIFLAPLFWLLYVGFLVGLSMIVSLIAMRYKDVLMFVGVAGTVALVISPSAYTYEMVPASMKALMDANPLSYYIRGLQHAVAFNSFPPPSIFIGAVSFTLISLLGGYFFMEKQKHVYFDQI